MIKHQQDQRLALDCSTLKHCFIQPAPTPSAAAWTWCISQFVCERLHTETLKKQMSTERWMEQTRASWCGSGSPHRFHIQTLIPCLLTHHTTGHVNSSCLYRLNRGITEDQTHQSAQNYLPAATPVGAGYCSTYFHPDICVIAHQSISGQHIRTA